MESRLEEGQTDKQGLCQRKRSDRVFTTYTWYVLCKYSTHVLDARVDGQLWLEVMYMLLLLLLLYREEGSVFVSKQRWRACVCSLSLMLCPILYLCSCCVFMGSTSCLSPPIVRKARWGLPSSKVSSLQFEVVMRMTDLVRVKEIS